MAFLHGADKGPHLAMMLQLSIPGKDGKANRSVNSRFKQAGFRKRAQRRAIGTPAPGIVPRSNGRAGGNGTARPAKRPAGAESGALASPPADKARGSAPA